MAWIAVVLAISVAVALLRGGRFLNLSEINLRAWPLLILGFGLQVLANYVPAERSWSQDLAVALVIVSYVPLLALVWLNREEAGMGLVGVGIFMNFIVISLNGGMPVLPEAAALALGKDVAEISFSELPKHVVLDEGTRLMFLGDVIPLRPIRNVISLGDVFLAVGLGQFLENQLRRPVRWFRHGLGDGQAGSARITSGENR